MKIAIMQPYAFPYLGYFQLMAATDLFVLLDDVHFIKGGWINHNTIMGPNKEPWRFTIPLQQASQNKLINEVTIAPDHDWREKLLKTIKRSYCKAPCFETAWPLVDRLISNAHGNLADFIAHCLHSLNSHLQISTPIVRSSDYACAGMRGQDRILAICTQAKASHYLNPPGGRELYDSVAFESQGISLNFIDHQPVAYKQFGLPFAPRLSIIDVIMFNDPGALRQRLTEYSIEQANHPSPNPHG